MTFRASFSWLFGSIATPASQERAKQLNAAMDEFVRLLHTNGYDSKSPATLGEVAGLSERPSCAQDAQSSNQGL
ncbi:hypothetical protein [Tardiphaga sp.]|uniref:hypothetical protein n=1 Tax=Tardiphaga sp. TaxID=1926292 RepID=UPI00352A00BF